MPGLSAQPWDVFAYEAIQTRSRYFLGLSFIFLQCIAWVVAAVMTQYLYENEDFNSPFLMSYIGMSMLALLLPLRIVTDRLGVTEVPSLESASTVDTFDYQIQSANQCSDYVNIANHRTKELINNKVKKWNHKKHFLAALLVAPAMFGADFAFNTALATTSVASASVLVSTQSVFVFVLAVAVKLEPFSYMKLCGVVLTVSGTAFTALHDSDGSGSHALSGDIIAIVAALMYATYTVMVRVFCPQDEELYSMQLLLGYIGLVCFVPLLPFGLYIMFTQVQLTFTIVGVLLLKGFIDFCIIDYCLFRAIILTSATVATVGLGMTIPMAFLADWLAGKASIVSIYSILGALAVSAGFLVVNLAPETRDVDAAEPSTTEETELNDMAHMAAI